MRSLWIWEAANLAAFESHFLLSPMLVHTLPLLMEVEP